jgi:hypothetical protein
MNDIRTITYGILTMDIRRTDCWDQPCNQPLTHFMCYQYSFNALRVNAFPTCLRHRVDNDNFKPVLIKYYFPYDESF